MSKFIYYSILSGLVLISHCRDVLALTCTAAPSCDDLGYINTNCPKGGIKCPFDSNKMFCIRDGVSSNFSYANAINRYHIVYADGTTGKFYNSDKIPIGIVTYVHPTKSKKHGLMMSLKTFTIQNQSEAQKICAAYTTAGTMAGDWHLPDLAEISTMSAGDTFNDANEYTAYRDVLKTIPTAGDLEYSFSFYYNNSLISGGIDISNSQAVQGSFASHTFFYSRRVTTWFITPNFVSSGQTLDSASNAYISSINSSSGLTSVAATKKMQFRCVALF